MPATSDAKALVKALRYGNIQSRRFVPDGSLAQLMTKKLISQTLEDLGVNAHRRGEIAGRVVQSGKKIFAILILIDSASEITKFIETGELHDVKLPFNLEILTHEINVSNPHDFEENQWEFVAPNFVRGTLNRRLKPNVILPFTAKEEIGHGAFGTVFKVRLVAGHHDSQNSFPQLFVQKELKSAEDHRQELENLAILNHLKHPNIVELLASYTYQGRHNLLFPLMEHGTLADLLESNLVDTEFRSDAGLLVALVGLSSAIEHVHVFFERRIDLTLIGCHHDLRPKNILVSGKQLILADFGLSRFKDTSETSETMFRLGIGDYLAPECEDPDTNFEPQRIRRSSDVWSFGCILLEAVVYMLCGPTAIKNFRDARAHRVRAMKLHTFHHGPMIASEPVRATISKCAESSKLSHKMLTAVVCRMLSMEPSARPAAAEVTCRLQLVAIAELASLVDVYFSSARNRNNSLDLNLEHLRFMAWKLAIGITEAEEAEEAPRMPDIYRIDSFETLHHVLEKMANHLEWLMQQLQDTVTPTSHLRLFNDKLIEVVGAYQQERARMYFRISLIDTADTRMVFNEGDNVSQMFFERDLRLSASLKHMTKLIIDHKMTNADQALIDSSKVLVKETGLGNHSFGQVVIENHSREVLIEWRKYGSLSADEKVNQELFTRLNALVKLLSADKPENMRALRCSGYFHDENRPAFGMIYDLPRLGIGNPASVHSVTLHQWISRTTNRSSLWPVLDDRYELAHQLARSVLEFHLVGWLHKSLTASNIAIFSESKSLSGEDMVKDCYIVGFDHSRQNDPFASTTGLPDTADLAYQHPKYRVAGQGYKSQYDYYSLGIVLMEVGFWKPVREIAGIRDVYGPEHDRKILSRVPLLKQYMGCEYSEAVMMCLDGFESLTVENSNNEDGTSEHTQRTLMDFEIKVLSRLSGCLGLPKRKFV